MTENDPVRTAGENFRYRCLKLAVAFVLFWSLVISGVMLGFGGCARADMGRVNALPQGCARPSLPIRVGFEPDAAALAETVLGAAETWSEATGLNIARLAAPGEDVDLMVVDGPRNETGWDAQVETVRDEDRCYKVMTFMKGFDLVSEYFMALHEWGHVIGLKDDPRRKDSVMFHWVSPEMMDGEAGPDAVDERWPTISPADIATVRALY